MKKSIYVSLTDWIGRNLIGDIEEIARRSEVRLRHDFYWPRKSIVLPKASNIELVERLGENELRRSMARSTVLFCMAISFPLSAFLSFGVPSIVVGTKTSIKNITSGAKNLTNFSTGCILGREDRDSLLSCQKSLRGKSGNIDIRLQGAFSDKAKFETAYSLVSVWKQKDEAERQGTGEVDTARFKAAEEQLSQTLSESEISELRSIYNEYDEYNKELSVISAKLKVDFYKTKAQSGGLTEQENADYQAQVKIIKNKGGK